MGAASRPLADVLLTISASPHTLVFLTVAWAAVFLLATQVPQLHAAGMMTDGLPRSEVLALHALGLDRLAWSLGVWLLAGLTTFAALAPLVSGRARWQPAEVLRGVALVSLLGVWLWQTAGSPPVTLDIQVGDPVGQVQSAMHDGGGPAPAPGRWQATCRAHAGSEVLDCAIAGAGLRHQIGLAPGVPAESQGVQFTWLSSSVAPLPKQMTLSWRATQDARQVFALALRDGESTSAPLLAATFQPQVIKEAGPLLLVRGTGSKPTVRLLASPDVLPHGRPTAQVVGEPLIQVQVAPAHPQWPLALVFLALASTFVLALRPKHAPSAEVG